MTQNDPARRDLCLDSVLYGHRRRPGVDGLSSFEVLFGVKPRFAVEPSRKKPGEEVVASARHCEVAMALINRAERLVPRTIHPE